MAGPTQSSGVNQSEAQEPAPPPVPPGSAVATVGEAIKQSATMLNGDVPPVQGPGTTRGDAKLGETVPAREVVSRAEKFFLFGVLSIVLLAIAGYIVAVSIQQFSKYNAEALVARQLLEASSSYEERMMLLRFIALTSGPQDVLIMRHITVFLGFVIVVIGAMFVLTGIETSYQLRLKGVKTATTLKTSSPGLVLISIGAVLVFGALYRSVSMGFGESAVDMPQKGALQDTGKQEAQSDENPYTGGSVH